MDPIKTDLSIVYNTLLRWGRLKRKELLIAGLTDYRLKKLVKEGYLESSSNGIYTLSGTEGLEAHAKKLLDNGDESGSKLCLKKCQEMKSHDNQRKFDLFLENALDGNLENALAHLLNIGSEVTLALKGDVNFYLFLMSFVAPIQATYHKKIKELSEKDIKIPNDPYKYGDVSFTKIVRNFILRGDFDGALNRIEMLRKKDGLLTTQNRVTKKLLKIAIYKRTLLNKKVNELAQTGRIHELLELLKEEESIHNLSNRYRAVMSLASDIACMEKTGVYLASEKTESMDVFDLISTHNYEKALEFYDRLALTGNLSDTDRTIVLLLEKTQEFKKDNPPVTEKEDDTRQVDDSQNDLLVRCLIALMNSNNSKDNLALSLLDTYLIKNGLTEYGYLIRALIEISAAEHDTTFMRPMVTISRLYLGRFEMRVNGYIDDCYYHLAHNNLVEAKMYLELIKAISMNGHSDIPGEELAAILAELSEKLAKRTALMTDTKRLVNSKNKPNKKK